MSAQVAPGASQPPAKPASRAASRQAYLDRLETRAKEAPRPDLDAHVRSGRGRNEAIDGGREPGVGDDGRRADLVVQELDRLVQAGFLSRKFSVLHVECGSGSLLARIREAFPDARCHGVDWPAAAASVISARRAEGIRISALYIDQMFQTRPQKRERFDVVLMSERFELPGAAGSGLLPHQADGWLSKHAKYVIGEASAERLRELRNRGMRLRPIDSPRGGSRMICWTSEAPLSGSMDRTWSDRADGLFAFPSWVWQNARRHGIVDASYYAGNVVRGILDGRLPPAALADRDLRTRFCATLAPIRPVRTETVYVFVFLGEFGYEMLNWQGVVRRFARSLPSSSAIVVGGRRGLQPFYETAAQYIEIDDLPEYRESHAAAYFAMAPEEFRRQRPPSPAQFAYDVKVRRAIEHRVLRELKIHRRRVEFVFSSQLNVLGDCRFGVDPRFYGVDSHGGSIYAALDVANNEFARIRAETEPRPSIETRIGFDLDEPYVLVQSRQRMIGPQSGGSLDARPFVEMLSRQLRVVFLRFDSGRHLDSRSRESFDGVTEFECTSFREQSCLIAHARHCVFLTEGDLGSHTYLPPLLGKDVVVVGSRDVFSMHSAPIEFWNRNVFRFGGRIVPVAVEELAGPRPAQDALQRLRDPGGLDDAQSPSPTKRILFVMRHEGYVRNCEYVLEQLAENGHSIRIAVEKPSKKAHDRKVLPRLAAKSSSITHGRLPPLSDRPWDAVTGATRAFTDYVRYLDEAYDHAPRLKARRARKAPRVAVTALDRVPVLRSRRTIAAVKALTRGVERIAPTHFECDEYLAKTKPDLVVVTGSPDSDSPSFEFFKSAIALGIPTALCVASWDNLSSKGLVQIVPDRVVVWNEIQKHEAVTMHSIPADRVVVTGAHLFDHWFEMKPSCSREEFCCERGLDPALPYLLYVCSSGFIATEELAFVERWIESVRARPALARLGILVRPHGANPTSWHGSDLAGFPNVSVWPPCGEGPVDEESKQHYFDSLYHASAIVGINTSAMIEGGVVGRRVFTILADEFRETQVGTIHFHYLVDGGLVTPAANFDEHVEQLEQTLADGEGRDAAGDRFVREFVRPHGLETPSTPLAVRALEELMSESPVGAGRKARGRAK